MPGSCLEQELSAGPRSSTAPAAASYSRGDARAQDQHDVDGGAELDCIALIESLQRCLVSPSWPLLAPPAIDFNRPAQLQLQLASGLL
jgi:hypothetical protein